MDRISNLITNWCFTPNFVIFAYQGSSEDMCFIEQLEVQMDYASMSCV